MADRTKSLAEHQVELSRELIDDIELSRLIPEQLLLKGMRLARICSDKETTAWLKYELSGYKTSEVGLKFMGLMGRWTEKEKQIGYWMPFPALEGMVASAKLQIQQIRVPDAQLSLASANPHEFISGFAGSGKELAGPATLVLYRMGTLADSIPVLEGIRSRVLAHLHSFVCNTYYKLAFLGAMESIFQQHQVAIDGLLRSFAPEVLEKIPSISERLFAGDAEAISQAMNSCRRMIKALADSIYPPSETPVDLDGEPYAVGTDNVLNRIKLHLHAKCSSKSRRDRLNKNLRQIFEKASAGTHDDITPSEARSLFLGTYLALGEVLEASTGTMPAPSRPST